MTGKARPLAFRRIAGLAGGSVLAFLLLAIGLVASQRPGSQPDGEVFAGFADRAPVLPLPQRKIAMRDGFALTVRHLPAEADRPLLVLLHGSGWYGQQFDRLAPQLSDLAEIAVPDLRGHGPEPGRRGDVDYIGQYEDDLADLIAALRKPGQAVVLAGHSSGGGLAVRMAGGPHGALLDRAILLAPFLQHDAPVTRPRSGGWARPLTRRIIGLSLLNAVGIRALNHLPVIEFAMPARVLDGPLGQGATTAYSYRLNTGFSPRRDYLSDVAALPPFLLVAGQKDEAFIAEGYEPLIAPVNAAGTFHLVEGVGHLGIVDAAETVAAMREFLGAL
jgi:pimeloyl-ACP methyl ester carboxylesterase